MVDTKVILQAYKEYLLSDGKSPTTVESYTGDITAFLEWLKAKDTQFQGTLKRFHITSYRSQLVEQQFGINTINKKINSLHSFNHYLVDQKLMQELVVFPAKDKVKRAGGSEQEVVIFTEQELERILFYLQDSDKVRQKVTRGRFY